MNTMNVSRRSFILGGASFLSLAGGNAVNAKNVGPRAKIGDFRTFLVHLGHNMWCDWYPAEIDTSTITRGLPDSDLRCKDGFWREVVDYIVSKGMNQIVIDVGEGLVFPRRPELAINGSWSAEKLSEEVTRLQAFGVEVIPKLNFSATHNGWLKHYRRMVGTCDYYRVCEDVLKDVSDVFGKPRFIHIGCDEEDGEWHVMKSKTRQYVLVRRGEVWKHDFLHLVKTCERLGARAWAWSDYGWIEPSFMQWCPKSVLLSNWFYDEAWGGFDLEKNDTSDKNRLRQFWQLEEAGYDQVPCGTNWVGWKRRKENVGADDVIGKLVKLGRTVISTDRLYGFMMAPWAACDTRENVDFNKRGADLFSLALAQSGI